ncbi:MAG: antitoxin [Deltaproteobacteria bacterium]|nr:antitoxin [Deltaproteobacteria bacterium]
MTRTTVDIDDPVLRELKVLQKKEGRSLGKIVSRLLAEALAHERVSPQAPKLQWTSRPMGAMVDLADKEALYAALDQDEP